MSLNNLRGVYIHKLCKLVTYWTLPYNSGAVRLSSVVAVLVALTLARAPAEPLDAVVTRTAVRPETRIAQLLSNRAAGPARGARQTEQTTSQGDPRGHRAAERLGWFDLSVRDGWRTLESYGVARDERALALTVIARQLSGRDRGVTPSDRVSSRATDDSSEPPTVGDVVQPSVTIPVPLTEEVWRTLLRLEPRDDLFDALRRDRGAMLLCLGLTATDGSVRALLLRDRDLLAAIHRESPGAFAVTARRLRLDAGSVVLPGGVAAGAMWRALVDESPTEPAAFIRALLSRDRGRLALFYDTLSGLAPEHLARLLGTGIEAPTDRAPALYDTFRSADPNWDLESFPFVRAIADPWSAVALIDVDASGIAGPAWSRLWRALFDDEEMSERAWRDASASDRAPMSLATVTRHIVAATARERRDRFEMVRLAQRAFPAATGADAVAMATALGGYRRYRGLLLTLERLGVTAPAVWAHAVRAARHVDENPREDRRIALSCVQGALALVERVRLARIVDAATATTLIDSLSTYVERDAPASRGVAAWIVESLIPALPRLRVPDRWTGATAYESIVLQAMTGPEAARAATVTWEGLDFTVDLQGAERERLTRIRTALASPGLDQALASGDGRALADALVTLAYTPALGDPEGIIVLARDLPSRHAFGFDALAPNRRPMLPWSLAHDDQRAGVPWHVEGSLLGLDLGLARLALRRVADQQMPQEPTINLNDLLTFARTVVSLNPHDLTNEDRDAIVDAMARGRARVTAALGHVERLRALAVEARLSAARRELLPWMIAHDADAVALQFSLRDLFWLGGPTLPQDRLDRWGVDGRALDGRLATAMPRAAAWEDYAGRAEVGLMATQAPDLILRLAEETRRLGLPASLVPALLGFAVQDYWHDVDARFADDWPALTRAARAISPARVEDYVAALTGSGPLRSR